MSAGLRSSEILRIAAIRELGEAADGLWQTSSGGVGAERTSGITALEPAQPRLFDTIDIDIPPTRESSE